MAGGSNRLMVTMFILFVAVLLAYQQRDKTVEVIKEAAEAAASIATGGSNPSGPSSNTNYPTAQTGPRRQQPQRELPAKALKILSQFPAYLFYGIIYLARLSISLVLWISPLVVQPLQIMLNWLLIIFAPLITLIQALNYYLVLVPFGIAMSIGKTFYPLYAFTVTAILFGALMGAFGGWIHGGLLQPITGSASDKAGGEVHREITQLMDGKSASRRKGKGKARPEFRDEFDQETPRTLSPVKREELAGWRDSVW